MAPTKTSTRTPATIPSPVVAPPGHDVDVGTTEPAHRPVLRDAVPPAGPVGNHARTPLARPLAVVARAPDPEPTSGPTASAPSTGVQRSDNPLANFLDSQFGGGQPAPTEDAVGAEPEEASAPSTPDDDAVFRRLYPRVRDELRWELRVQRERAGLLGDPL